MLASQVAFVADPVVAPAPATFVRVWNTEKGWFWGSTVKLLVTTDVAATLRKEDLPRTVDGLKKAVLKNRHHRILKDKCVADLKVYPPGKERGEEAYGSGATVGDVDTAVVAAPEEAPYHVVVT